MIIGVVQLLLVAFAHVAVRSEQSYPGNEPVVLTWLAAVGPLSLLLIHALAMYSAWVLRPQSWSVSALAAFSAMPIALLAILWTTAQQMNRAHGSSAQLLIKSGVLKQTEWGSGLGLLAAVVSVGLAALLGVIPLIGTLIVALRRK